MFNQKFGEIFPYLYNQFEASEIILVDSDVNYWQKVLKNTNINVHFVSNSINKFDSQIDWSFYNTLLWNEEKEVYYYEFNNPLLNGTISTDILKNIWKNIETKSTKIISAEDINNFIYSNISNDSNKFLILENLDSYNIIKNLDINTHNIKVLAIRTINDIAVNSSKIDLDKFIEKNNFRKIMYYEDHHPKLGLIVYIKDDIKSLTLSLEEKNNELQNISNTLEEKKKNLSSKNSDNQKLKDDIKSLTLSLEEKNNELQNISNTLEEKKKNLSSKNSDNQKLKDDIKSLTLSLEEKNNELQNISNTLEEEKKNLSSKNSDNQKLKDEVENLNKQISILERSLNNYKMIHSNTLDLEYLNKLEIEEKVELISSFCINQKDILEVADNFLLSDNLNDLEKFDLCINFSSKIIEIIKDKHQGLSFLNNSLYFLNEEKEIKRTQLNILLEKNIKYGQSLIALDLQMKYFEEFDDKFNKLLINEYNKISSIAKTKKDHGHRLLIDYIDQNIEDTSKKLMIEIGTTRENILGQGSTIELAKFCKSKGINFITVDMDPHNTRWANFLSKKYNLDFKAITKKGEDFLKSDIDKFDFIFLDAYDFDHGKHSELRQSRYEKNLGNRIDEEACHKMHLECAISIKEKLNDDGIVCIDDTWLDADKNWTAKGTLAVPYLLDLGYYTLTSNTNALILKKPTKIIIKKKD